MFVGTNDFSPTKWKQNSRRKGNVYNQMGKEVAKLLPVTTHKSSTEIWIALKLLPCLNKKARQIELDMIDLNQELAN